MSTGRTRLEFHSGVARFDAMGNLFVHLPHSTEDPLPVLLGDETEAAAPPRDKRALVKGQAEAALARGTFPTTNDLPRGSLVVSVQGYDSLVLRDDGALEVELADVAELPGWFRAGERHLFRRPGQPVRLWTKSSLPSGIQLSGEAADTAPAPIRAAPVPAPTAETKPAAEAQPAARSKPSLDSPPKPEPVRAPSPEPRQPRRTPDTPVGARRADGASRLAGCTGLLALCALGVALGALLLA